MHQVESGKLSLSDRIITRAADERLPSGVLYALEPGLSPTIKDLLTRRIYIDIHTNTDSCCGRFRSWHFNGKTGIHSGHARSPEMLPARHKSGGSSVRTTEH